MNYSETIHYFSSIIKKETQQLYKFLVQYLFVRDKFVSFLEQDFTHLFGEEIPSSCYSFFEYTYQFLEKGGFLEEKKVISRKLSLLLPSLIEQFISSSYNFKEYQSFFCQIKSENEEEKLENEMLKKQVLEIIEQIPEVSDRDREIFYQYYGLNQYKSSTYPILANEYHLSKTRVRAINRDIGRKIRKNDSCKKFKSVLEELSN